jgi:membrane fusion protein, multidrug efflux system
VLETSESTVRQFEAAVQIDQGQIASAQLQITYCRVTAPISGRVGLRLIDVGNIVHASDANGLAVITQLQPITVVFTLPQDDIVRVIRAMNAADGGGGGSTSINGLEVEAYDRDLRNKLGTGTLSALDNQVDPTTGTVRLKATFANEEGVLFPNQFVNARLLVETRKDAILVPAAAIQRGPDSTFVYIVKADTVQMRNVTVGPTEGDLTVVDTGIEAGEIVVTDGVDKLQSGSKVTVRNGATTRPGRGAAGGPAPAGRKRAGGRGPGSVGGAGPTTRPQDSGSPTTHESTSPSRHPATAPANDNLPGGGE